MSERIQFLQSFLGALGAREVLISAEEDDRISGTVVYDPLDPEEQQDFCWHATEDDVPEQPVRNLAGLLHEQGLLDIDKVSISFDALMARYNRRFQSAQDADQFTDTVSRLFAIRVDMVDDGEEGDAFRIHG